MQKYKNKFFLHTNMLFVFFILISVDLSLHSPSFLSSSYPRVYHGHYFMY